MTEGRMRRSTLGYICSIDAVPVSRISAPGRERYAVLLNCQIAMKSITMLKHDTTRSPATAGTSGSELYLRRGLRDRGFYLWGHLREGLAVSC